MGKQRIHFRPPLFCDDDPVMWIDVEKVDSSWSFCPLYVGPQGVPDNQAVKSNQVGKWILMGGIVEMPVVGLGEDLNVSFSDGRHRFAWLRDNGASLSQCR